MTAGATLMDVSQISLMAPARAAVREAALELVREAVAEPEPGQVRVRAAAAGSVREMVTEQERVVVAATMALHLRSYPEA